MRKMASLRMQKALIIIACSWDQRYR